MNNLIVFIFFIALSSFAIAQHDNKISSDKKCNFQCVSKEDCTNLITENVAINWARQPLKEKNNLVTTVKISLLSNGDIEYSSIANSSGNERFDNSVLQAIKRAGSFCEIQGLTQSDYEKYFKEFTIAFRNEDSRY